MADLEELNFGLIPNNENPAPIVAPPPAPQPQPALALAEAEVPAPTQIAPPPPPPVVRRRGPVPPPPAPAALVQNVTNITRRASATKPKKEGVRNKNIHKLPPASDAEEWIRFHVERPMFYKVAPDGSYYNYPADLSGNIRDKATIQPTPFYRASLEQIQENYKRQRMEPAVVNADDVYIRTRKDLLALYREYKAASVDPAVNPIQKIALRTQLIQANNTHSLAEKARSRVYGRTPFIEELEGSQRPFQFEMLPDEAIDKTSPFRDTVYICRRSNFPVSNFYTDTLPIVEAVAPPVPAANAENPATAQQGGGNNYTEEQKQIIARKRIAAWRTRKAGRF